MNQRESPAPLDPMESLAITLELVHDAGEGDQDPALVSAIGSDTVETLQRNGYALHPIYTGQRGGSFLVEVITAISQVASQVWANKAVIEEVVNDTAALTTVFSAVIPIARSIFHIHEQRVGKDESQAQPLTIVIEVDGARISLAASDLTQADAALTVAQHFVAAHPQVASQVTTRSKVSMQGRIPRRPRRRRK